jgi:hypothetical protein
MIRKCGLCWIAIDEILMISVLTSSTESSAESRRLFVNSYPNRSLVIEATAGGKTLEEKP